MGEEQTSAPPTCSLANISRIEFNRLFTVNRNEGEPGKPSQTWFSRPLPNQVVQYNIYIIIK